ncbi:MAG: cobalamin-dependent protein [Thermodesulfobacterium sp.]|nr:cobalamin-dependent protein [Thermodesulfobacterium sp.]
MIEELIKEAKEKLKVSPQAAKDYEENKPFMLNFVNQEMTKRSDLLTLIGFNSLQIMYDNHTNHANFMANVFKYSLFEMLVKMVPWVYKAYSNHGFSYDYFLVELHTWKRAVENFLPSSSAKEINRTYEWLIEKHEEMIELSQKQDEFKITLERKWEIKKERFLSHLLRADFNSAVKFANRLVKSPQDLENFYLKILQPALYEIGSLWEKGKISVAEEHLATSIVGRVMANIYTYFPKNKTKAQAKAIITSSPNEYHELGGRMVADLLEMDGWDVYYLGANVPEDEVLKLVKKIKPKLIGISVTMPFNLERTEKLISKIRSLKGISLKIMVGGLLFNLFPEVYLKLGADFWASDAKKAVEIAKFLKSSS